MDEQVGLGQERLGGDLSIAVDPRDSSTVYMVWADLQAGVYTLHLRRSTNRGVNWSPADLLTIDNGKNPSLAINSHGKIGFLYQQVTGTAPNQRWETHVRRSTTGTMWDDVTLANVPANAPAATFLPYIGDYAHLMAVGKDFYGVFSANNTPNKANFPSGVTYQRNANFANNQLLDLGNSPVAVSIDPFFFQLSGVPPADDFYVRDWTDSPSSGDTGLEPSTHPVFYTTSDVWNRRGTLPGSFPNDQPECEDAGNGAGNIGDNWAFARIRRNATQPSGSQTVTAHFLVSKLGTGSNYVDAGSADPDVTFPNPDPTGAFNAANLGPILTKAYPWHLNAVSSTHLCLAVEISSPGDPFVAPSLVGNTPGWWTGTDLRVINDNNKAQRNMGLSTTPAGGVAMSVTFYAIAHNGATFFRSMRLRYVTPQNTLSQIKAGAVEVIGGRTRLLKSSDEIVLPNMQPGENRWVGITVKAPHGRPGDVLSVNFYEMVGKTPINGFAIAVRLADLTEAVRENLRLHRSVFNRMAAGFAVPEAEAAASKAYDLLRGKQFSPEQYLGFLRSHGNLVGSTVRYLIKSQGALEPFYVNTALKDFSAAVGAGNAEDVAAVHVTLLNKLDSFLTMRQLAQGDPADILQNVRWQKALFEELPQLRGLACGNTVRVASTRFIAAYGERRIGNKEYPQLIRELLDCFREASRSPRGLKLRLPDSITQIERNLNDLTALQGAHRNFLLNLQETSIVRSVSARIRRIRLRPPERNLRLQLHSRPSPLAFDRKQKSLFTLSVRGVVESGAA